MNRNLKILSAACVWTAWSVAVAGLLMLAITYTVNAPWGDEWDHVETLTGVRPLNLQFLWAQHNEHRIAIPKLLWIASLRLSHFNFRVLSFLHVLLLAILSGAFIVHAKALRGWTSITDAFLPLLVLNPANYQNVLWAWQIGFILPTFLSGLLLLPILRNTRSGSFLTFLTWKTIIGAGVCLMMLPLCGGPGVLFAPAIALWWGYLGVAMLRAPIQSRNKAGFILATVGITLALTAIYPIGLQPVGNIPPSPGIRASLLTVLEVFTGSFGAYAGSVWPVLGGLISALMGTTLLALVWMWYRGGMRVPVTGLLLFFAASLAVALGIGWKRAGLGAGSGLLPRYVLLMVPALACVYFVWEIGPWKKMGRVVQAALLALAVFMLPMSIREAAGFRHFRLEQQAALKEDLDKGLPAPAIVSRNGFFLDHFFDNPAEGAGKLRLMRQAGMNLFLPLEKGFVRYGPSKPEGTLDRATEDQIAGWAWDRFNPNAKVQVDLFDGATLIDRIDAATFRQDLLDASIGSGKYGFVYIPPIDLADGQSHTIRVVVSGSDFELPGSPKTISFGRGPKFVETPVRESTGGTLDVVDDKMIAGWAWDSSQPNSHVQVQIFDGNALLTTIGATQVRADLREAHIGRGDHGFIYSFPDSLRDGKPHTIRVVVAGVGLELEGSPRKFTASR